MVDEVKLTENQRNHGCFNVDEHALQKEVE